MHLLFGLGSIRIRHDIRLVWLVLADDLLHTDHIVPAAEFVATVVEGAREGEMCIRDRVEVASSSLVGRSNMKPSFVQRCTTMAFFNRNCIKC